MDDKDMQTADSVETPGKKVQIPLWTIRTLHDVVKVAVLYRSSDSSMDDCNLLLAKMSGLPCRSDSSMDDCNAELLIVLPQIH